MTVTNANTPTRLWVVWPLKMDAVAITGEFSDLTLPGGAGRRRRAADVGPSAPFTSVSDGRRAVDCDERSAGDLRSSAVVRRPSPLHGVSPLRAPAAAALTAPFFFVPLGPPRIRRPPRPPGLRAVPLNRRAASPAADGRMDSPGR